VTAELEWHKVAHLADFWEGELRDAEVGADTVLLVHLPGPEVKAYQGLCPHQEVLLVDGDWDEDAGTLICSGHRWEFDLRTGKGVNPSDCRLYEFPVRIEDESVLVGVPRDGQRHYLRANESE
jgi:toluene monooxygenase system ferredoxin subunit